MEPRPQPPSLTDAAREFTEFDLPPNDGYSYMLTADAIVELWSIKTNLQAALDWYDDKEAEVSSWPDRTDLLAMAKAGEGL